MSVPAITPTVYLISGTTLRVMSKVTEPTTSTTNQPTMIGCVYLTVNTVKHVSVRRSPISPTLSITTTTVNIAVNRTVSRTVVLITVQRTLSVPRVGNGCVVRSDNDSVRDGTNVVVTGNG